MTKSKDEHFIDDAGCHQMYRGFNLATKNPVRMDSFYDGVNVSFAGSPWPLEVADEHARNLIKLGMNFVRLSVPWEAVMHAGPNEFDEEYLTYLGKLVTILEKHHIHIDIDPHQDDWSRYSGGDGAPKWTFELAGLIPENFYETVAAVTEYEYRKDKNKPLQHLYWQTNLSRMACQTMFTLFWAGNTYAPQLGVQDFLQDQYLLFLEKVAQRLKGNTNIIGFSTMNEPLVGYINNTDLTKIPGKVRIGLMPTPIEAWALGDGMIMNVGRHCLGKRGFYSSGREKANLNAVRVWENECIWKLHKLWDYDDAGTPQILQKDYFQTPSRDIFANVFYKPFTTKFYKVVRAARENTRIHIQLHTDIEAPDWDLEKDGKDVMFGQHFYDPVLLAFKWHQNIYNLHFTTLRIVFFKYFIDRLFRMQFAKLSKMVKSKIGNVPFLLVETGFVMDASSGFIWKKGPATKTGNYKYVAKSAQRTFQAIEAERMNACIWNYNIHNTLKDGDGWNSEDFSVYCKDLDDPIRAREGWWRPYAQKTPGIPLFLKYSPTTRVFYYIFKFDESITAPCEITLPEYLVAAGDMMIRTSGGKTKVEEGMLKFWPNSNKPWVKIRFAGGFSIWKPKTWFSV